MADAAETSIGGSDPYSIASHDQLRAVIPEAKKKTQLKVVTRFGALERAFVNKAPMVFISTAGLDGRVTVSPKGDAPGFVAIAGDSALLIPERPGNGLAYGLSNLIDNPHIGLLFVIPGSTETFRVDGSAELTRNPELLRSLAARSKDALLVIRVQVERCFFHCSKAFLRSRLWEAAEWPEPFKLSWGEWAKQWFDVSSEIAQEIDQETVRDEVDNL